MNDHDISKRLTRRDFLNSTCLGLGATLLGHSRAGEQNPPADNTDLVFTADERIKKHRTARVRLTFKCPPGITLQADQPVAVKQQTHRFLFGCNLFKLGRCRTEAHNAAYTEKFAELLNFATLPFYWWSYEREEGKPDDRRTEQALAWCKSHRIMTKGHPLAWNYIDPPWLKAYPDQAMALQLKRIERCVERFKGDIDIWDVVNEATHFDRATCHERSPVLTKAIGAMGIESYVRAAFDAARRASNDATLIINDYRTDPAFINKVISKLVTNYRQPLYDVIGIQSPMHGGAWSTAKQWEVCERFAPFSKPLHFTETTVVSGPKKKEGWKSTTKGESQQAKQVARFYKILFSHPAVEAITWWDFTDQNAWQGAPAGLLREDMTPKPAYDRLHDLIKRDWWTRTQTTLNGEHLATFRGFLGKYQVKLKAQGKELTGTFSLDKPGEQVVGVELA